MLRRSLHAAVLLPVLAAAGAPAVRAQEAQDPAAMVIEADAVVGSQVVGLGRDVEVRGRVLADVAVLSGTARISGQVEGDVIVLDGDASLTRGARVSGDLYVLGGTATVEPGAAVEGRSVSYPTASGAWLTLIEAPSFGLEATSAVVLGTKAALLTAWVALMLALFGTGGREVLATSEAVAAEPFSCFFAGLTGVLTLVMAGLLVAAFAGPLVSLPLVALLVLGLVGLKLWGVVAVFHALGHKLGSLLGRRLAPLTAASAGLLLLGALKFVPDLGTWVWMLTTLIGVGAALKTKLGRRRPWIDLEGVG